MSPPRDDGVTIEASVRCARCGIWFHPRGRQTWCSAACRQAGFRCRHPPPLPTASAGRPLVRLGRAATVYACPQCEARMLGSQRCPECNIFGARVGMGGLCPECEAPVAVADLLPELAQLLERTP